VAIVACSFVGAAGGGSKASSIVTQDMATGGQTASSLVNTLVGADVTPTNASFTGAAVAGGVFSGGTGPVGFDSGVVLSSGAVANVVGPNAFDNRTTNNGTAGDTALNALVTPFTTHDAAVLEFDFVPKSSPLTFRYVFASEEYNEYVNSSFNDVFAFFIGGTNCAIVPDSSPPQPVAINTINGGNPLGTAASNPSLYRNNDLSDGGGSIDTEMDGLTVVLTCTASVTPGQSTHVKLAIADTSDAILDSAVFLEAGSFTTAHGTKTEYSGGTSVQYSDAASLSGTLVDTAANPDAPVPGKTLDFVLGTQAASAGPTSATGSAATSLVVTQQPGSVTSVSTSFAGDADFGSSSDSDPFSIEKEDCTLAYSGDTLVAPATMTTLAADLGEPDSSLGDRSGKAVTFAATGVADPTVRTFNGVTDASGHVSTTAALPADVYSVSVSFAGDAFYKACATSSDTLVTVQAAGSKVTGGGWISIGTGRTSFGFNAIPEAGGLWKGQFQLRSQGGKDRFHGNVVQTLSGSANSATWSGTGSWNGQPGYRYEIAVEDNGSSGRKAGDTIKIAITSPSGAVAFSSGGAQELKGGNITVH
jgi:hypothetical protein